jgi:CRISPR-associated protein Cas1
MSTAGEDVPDLVPARMLNEYVYCPRLAYLEWVDQSFRDNADTVEGRFVHRRVDSERGRPPEPGRAADHPPSTSLMLSSEKLGLIAKVDVVESGGVRAVPVEYKRGRPRNPGDPLWPPEHVQLCAQVLLLREAGYEVDHAEVYFSESRTRHRVEIDEELIAQTMRAIEGLRQVAAGSHAPPPLVDSPKCPRCSLVGICLPDETNALRGASSGRPRRLVAREDPATPLYATTPGARLSKRGGRVVLLEDGKETASRRLIDVSHIAVFGNVTVGSALLRECFDAGIPVLWFSSGGWLRGFATGMPPKNVELRVRQYRASAVGAPELAAAFVAGKIRNSRTLIRRHGDDQARKVVAQLSALARQAEAERETSALLGIEGTAARLYFQEFPRLLKPKDELGTFEFRERNRRPPRDPVNALLSFVYALLVKDVVAAVLAVGLEPYVGLYHRPRFGRPALALDLAEEFRPLIGDSTVLTAINNGEVEARDFVRRAGAVALTPDGRKKVLRTYERRISTELVHPVFRYRTTYRRALEIQARLLAGALVGDIPAYRPLTTR